MTERQSHKRSRRILVVDDHPDTAASMALMLRELGHDAEYAFNGSAALTISETFRPQVVIVDMNLPDFHGSDLSRLLRIKAQPQKIRVIAITGYGESERRKAINAGCDSFVKKPVNWNDIDWLLG